MKKSLLFFMIALVSTACTKDFLDRYPKGRWNRSNYTPDSTLDKGILVEAKLAEAYTTLRGWPFCWALCLYY